MAGTVGPFPLVGPAGSAALCRRLGRHSGGVHPDRLEYVAVRILEGPPIHEPVDLLIIDADTIDVLFPTVN